MDGTVSDEVQKYVSRGGLKLEHALGSFGLDVKGLRCADFGCNVGGFTDCLLQRGAAHVTAVDTGYGTLAWKLRQDARVLTLERTNALHCAPAHAPGAPGPGGYDLVVVDMAWTPQRLCVPAAMRWLRTAACETPPTAAAGRADDAGGRIITLVKPHYEVKVDEKHLLSEGVLEEKEAERVVERTLAEVRALGAAVLGCVKSPVIGGQGKKNATGNVEWLALLSRASAPSVQ